MRHLFALPLSLCLALAAMPARADDPTSLPPPPPGAGSDCAGRQLLRPIMATHTVAPYPQVSVMTKEEGTTVLQVTIGPDGVPSDVQVATSSGSLRLDEAARDHVKANWKWQPPLNDCKPITAFTRVSITWSLRNASPGGAMPFSPALLLDALTVKVAEPSDFPAGLPPLASHAMSMVMVVVDPAGKVNAVPVTGNNPALSAKAVDIAKTYHWPQARLDGKAIGAMYVLMMVWPAPGKPIPKADDIKNLMTLFMPQAAPATAVK